jgi:hypothetical protein
MVGELRIKAQIRETFGKYVDPRIDAGQIDRPELTEPKGSRRQMTILFCDMKGFVIGVDRMICSRRLGAAPRRRSLQTACRFVTCRRHCRSPFAFGMKRDSRPGTSNRSSKEKKRSAITPDYQRIV